MKDICGKLWKCMEVKNISRNSVKLLALFKMNISINEQGDVYKESMERNKN